MRTLIVDLDGTLCEQVPAGESGKVNEAYFSAAPKPEVIAKVNQYYDSGGWTVIIQTARGAGTFPAFPDRVEAYLQRTRQWLRDNDVRYHFLSFDKRGADLYVDDKGMRPDEFAQSDPA